MANGIIFGGTSGVGEAIIRSLNPDYEFVFTYRSDAEKAKDIPGKAIYADMTNPKDVQNVFDQVDSLDLLVFSCFDFVKGDAFDRDASDKVLAYLSGYSNSLSCAYPKMDKSKGRIINMIGASAESTIPDASYYSAMFAYINNLSNGINSKFGKKGGIQALDLLMGPINTGRWKDPEFKKKYESNVRKFVEPQEIADFIKFALRAETFPTKFVWDGYYSLPNP